MAKFFLVGGAVRDLALGIDPQDLDYVAVGATESELLDQGYERVGRDFPVFLHPGKPGVQVALARRERKVALGYLGFKTDVDPSITLEDDLKRRDLTINAMALPVKADLKFALSQVLTDIIDPFGGLNDLDRSTLRHVSDAFVEDPLRVLRVARFAARYGFDVAPETLALCRQLVTNGELDHLARERVWVELWKGLGEKYPTRLLAVLKSCDALDGTAVGEYFAHSSFTADNLTRLFLTSSLPESTRQLTRALLVIAPADLSDAELNKLRIPHPVSTALKQLAAVKQVAYSSDPAVWIRRLSALPDLDAPSDVTAAAMAAFHSVYGKQAHDRTESLLKEVRQAVKSLDMLQLLSNATDKSTVARQIKEAAAASVLTRYRE